MHGSLVEKHPGKKSFYHASFQVQKLYVYIYVSSQKVGCGVSYVVLCMYICDTYLHGYLTFREANNVNGQGNTLEWSTFILPQRSEPHNSNNISPLDRTITMITLYSGWIIKSVLLISVLASEDLGLTQGTYIPCIPSYGHAMQPSCGTF